MLKKDVKVYIKRYNMRLILKIVIISYIVIFNYYLFNFIGRKAYQ